MEHTKKPNKISEIVRLQQILKKWKKLANAPKPNYINSNTTSTISKSSSSTNLSTSTSKSIKFLKKTLSFSDRDHSRSSSNANDVVPKGYVAVCVGKELKRFIIPTECLGHQAFGILLREAEEEFGFQQEGVLKIPCDVPLFEKILKMVQEKRQVFILHDPSDCFANEGAMSSSSTGCYSPDRSSCELTPTPHHPQLCR